MTDLAGLDDESRQMVVDTIGQVRKRLLTKDKILEFDKEEVFPEEIIREMLGPDIGLQLLFIPEEFGGMGGGARDTCAVVRELSKICLGVSTAFFAIQLGSDPILVGATEEQKEQWLGTIAEGDCLVAYGVTEAGAGSNLAALKTKADPVVDDAGNITAYKINGSKQFISNGGYADLVTVLANTPDGPSFFVVEKGMEGFTQAKGEEKHGIRASNTSPLVFEDVTVPAGNLIGGVPGLGLKQANQVFGYTRLMVAAMALGAADGAMDIVIPYAKERIQFGTPLSEKQGYTHKLVVPHAVRLTAASTYMDEIAVRLDSGEVDLQVEGAIGKLLATEYANDFADDAMQALGGYGYIHEYEVEKIKRDVKITCIYEGTSEIQQSIVSTFRWKATRKSKGEHYGSIEREMAEIHGEKNDLGAQFVSLSAKALNDVVNLVHENRLTKQQYAMFCLADMMASVEAAAAMVRKARKLTDDGDASAEKFRLMSRIYASETASLVAQNATKIVMGSGKFDEGKVAEIMESISCGRLAGCYPGLFEDMDRVADIIFER